jgi:23S rRNA pseudouridine1911/1915/1917 synthase
MELEEEIQVSAQDRLDFKRLDIFLAKTFPDLSRTFIKRLFENGLISSQEKIELKKMPKAGTVITVSIPPPTNIEAQPENIPLEVLFEDEHLIVINKPAGLVVHPAPGNYTGTLVNALLHHCENLSGIGGKIRPGIVHRLDKGTSGVMVAAKSNKAMENLIITFQKHDIKRQYEALTLGVPTCEQGRLESTIGRHPQQRLKMAANVKNGKEALTFYKKLHEFQNIAHLELTLETGRTHQIRVHLSSLLKTPILGDSAYADLNKQKQILKSTFETYLKDYPYPLLHAKKLEFKHPISGEVLSFITEPPSPFKDLLLFLMESSNEHSN